MVTMKVTRYSWAPSSSNNLFTCGAIFWPPLPLLFLKSVTSFLHNLD